MIMDSKRIAHSIENLDYILEHSDEFPYPMTEEDRTWIGKRHAELTQDLQVAIENEDDQAKSDAQMRDEIAHDRI